MRVKPMKLPKLIGPAVALAMAAAALGGCVVYPSGYGYGGGYYAAAPVVVAPPIVFGGGWGWGCCRGGWGGGWRR